MPAGALWALGTPAWAHADGNAVLSTQALLVVAAMLSVSLLVVLGVMVWHVHRIYLDTVHLHHAISEAHERFLSRALRSTQDDPPAPRSARPKPPAAPRPLPAVPPAPQRMAVPAAKAPPPPPRPVKTPAGLESAGGVSLAGLSDVERAVLEKLASDPRFFERYPLQAFGASSLTIESLVQRGLAKRDGLGRATVPHDVRDALRAWLPRN